ncbi:MAG: NAD(P)-dependent alcohol dehydrogenase [Propionibacteriaceae bacterium]|jgi:aryl-alcohol dehydrogenase|nr:NAD(P)-dependent alcohol dehydrogenase [Propionibacteriaceae bacterium]
MKIQAAITHEAGKLAIEEAEVATPKATEVLVRMVAAGVCHTDAAGIQQFIPVTLPAIFGHEGVGVVEEVGEAVDDLKPGDRVIMTYPSCGYCENCRDGHPFACESFNFLAFSGTFKDGTKRFSQNGVDISSFFGQGSFATYAIVDSRNAIKVEGVDDEELAYMCSLGCGVQTGAGMVFNVFKPRPATSIAVFGCGGVGMAALMAAKLAGCVKIIAVDVNPDRLALAREIGATDTVNPKEVEDTVQAIKDLSGGGVHYAAESSGIPALTLTAVQSLRRLGHACVVSVTGPGTIELPIEPALMNPSCTLTGITEGGANPKVFIPQLAAYYKAGLLPIDRLVKFYDFADIQQAFDDSHAGVTIKPILRF